MYVCMLYSLLPHIPRTAERIYIIEVSLDSYSIPNVLRYVKKNNHGGCRTPLDLVKKNRFEYHNMSIKIKRISKKYIMIIIIIMKASKKVKNKKKHIKRKTTTA